MRSLTRCSRIEPPRPLNRHRRDPHGSLRADLLLRAQRRRPGLHPEDLLRARADGDRGALRLRGGRGLLHPPPAHARLPVGPRPLRPRGSKWDLRSYVSIHLSLILGVGVLITGSIWARASWGHWWVWDEPTLVSFLIVFLLYATYQPLRFSIEDPERQARYASVFAICAGAFVPLNFAAVRMAQAFTHPRVLGTTGGSMPGDMRLTFLVALAGMACL